MNNQNLKSAGILIVIMAIIGCTPTVQIAVPSEPITININLKIQHEILVKVDRQIDDVFSDESGLF
jgi:hypothetical protein|tara:strand:- start:2863 stop:3060 length:198 start_codon:yes stop_codon:yes gene_type:complete